jgi:site-specific DNA-methyltransferase (cytosine-N4-specific)
MQRKNRLTNTGPGSFSQNSVCAENERIKLEKRYKNIFEETGMFSRKTVSFQASKVEALHGWVKYKEGFSAELVSILLNSLKIKKGAAVLDPFAGSCTTLLQAQIMGMNSTGIEILPNCYLAWKGKSMFFKYDVAELIRVAKLLENATPIKTGQPFPHIRITESSFPKQNEKDIVDYTHWINELKTSTTTKDLLKMILMDSLEELSFTRKDGQYLRWDSRAKKIVDRNKKREKNNKKPIKGIDKGKLPTVKSILAFKLKRLINDIRKLQKSAPKWSLATKHNLVLGSSLRKLPEFKPSVFNVVITSPPYLNRYDYTRTYALELAYLNIHNEIFRLRQSLLSATVENKSKTMSLKSVYKAVKREKDYNIILNIINKDKVLKEIKMVLIKRNELGEINNKGVLNMVQQYFGELAFIFFELYRCLKKNGYVVFVNDNVRYAGEVIPVDTISTNIAEQIGFLPYKIYVIPQRKGNSSQQMKKYGRREMRKSITIWKK